MIKKRYIIMPVLGLFITIIVIAAIGGVYILMSRRSFDNEVVFKATEFGTPVGGAVSKNIGPEGGTLSSPDGRLTLTVPEAALTETIPFTIQPVTNKFAYGLGNSYQLGPAEKTFADPLVISMSYDDNDLEGTLPEALSVAFQDKGGTWHMQSAIGLDKDAKTVTVNTTHFSIFDLVYGRRLSPSKATVHVGESVKIALEDCSDTLAPIVNFFAADPCLGGWRRHFSTVADPWKLSGEGKLTWRSDLGGMLYTAPGKKPSPNVATVIFYDIDHPNKVERPCNRKGDYPIVLAGKNSERTIIRKCYDHVPGPQSIKSEITIIDRGYKASGHDGPVVYSGLVCNLEKPFVVTVTNSFLTYPLNFVPSNGITGALSYNTTWKMLTMTGSGTYVINGADTDTPKIVAETKSTLSGMGHSSSGGGPAHIDLTPLDGNECEGQ